MEKSKLLLLLIMIVFSNSCGDDMNGTIDPTPTESDKLLYSKNPNGYNELYKFQNGAESLLISDSNYDYWWSKVSPDKSKFLVYRSLANPDKNHDDYEHAELLVADIDGSKLQVIIPKGKVVRS